MGIQVIQNILPDSNNSTATNVHDFVFKTPSDSNSLNLSGLSSGRNIMTLELLFGNQNIKEDRISQMQSVSDFLDQELYF
jgi:hypothetical protein